MNAGLARMSVIALALQKSAEGLASAMLVTGSWGLYQYDIA